MSHFSFLKQTDGMAEIIGYNPKRLQHFVAMIEELFRGPSELSVADREFIVTYVAGLNACQFCYGAHKAVAEAFGSDGDLLEAVIQTDDFDLVDAKMRPILALAKKLTMEPAKTYDADITAITDAGWSEHTVHDVICCVATMNFANRLVSGHGVEGSANYFKKDAEELGPDGGYTKKLQYAAED